MRVETPVVQAGVTHVRHIRTMVNTNTKIIVNPQTMKITSDLQLPKLPEVMTTEARTDLFVHKRLGIKPFHKVIRAHIKDVLSHLEILGKPKINDEIKYTTLLKVGNRYITVDETYKKIVLGDRKTEWEVISAIGNRTVATLRHPTLGFVYIEGTELVLSTTKRSYFFMEKHSLGLRLNALVPVDFTSVPEDLTRIQTPIMELVRILQRGKIAPEIVKRGLEWKLVRHISFSLNKFLNN